MKKYRVETRLWKDGSGFYANPTFDELDEFEEAKDYIESLDENFEIEENEDIEVAIVDNETDETLSTCWVKG